MKSPRLPTHLAPRRPGYIPLIYKLKGYIMFGISIYENSYSFKWVDSEIRIRQISISGFEPTKYETYTESLFKWSEEND